MPSQCRKIKNDGEQCKAYSLSESRFCFWHSVRMKEIRAEARKRGQGRRRLDGGEARVIS